MFSTFSPGYRLFGFEVGSMASVGPCVRSRFQASVAQLADTSRQPIYRYHQEHSRVLMFNVPVLPAEKVDFNGFTRHRFHEIELKC